MLADLTLYGARFRVVDDVDFVRYGMTDAPIDKLRAGIMLEDLSLEELPMVYALAVTRACVGEEAPVRRPGPIETRSTLIATLEDRIAQRVDHFALFGLPFDAPVVAVRSAFGALQRRLQPIDADSKKVVAHLTNAAAILTDPDRRATYVASAALARGTEREPIPALPDAVAVWARFAAAEDKQAIAEETRRSLAAASSRDMLLSTYYLACVARDLDRPREALRLFQRVLHLEPNHPDARRELAELLRKAEKKGLLDRFRR
jgi:tetratricopeptide (TPR) repeat protein